MPAVDSSVVVAGFAPWHEHHDAANRVIRRGARIATHAMLESYSVLTRLPGELRMPAPRVREYLIRSFPADRIITLGEGDQRDLITEIERTGVTGGATYDALIGITVAAVGATLWSLDRRALDVYERTGVTAHLATI